jgi:serine/threonine protein kinase
MEYIDGCTLTDYLTNNTLTLNDKLSLFELVADAVQEAHSKRIVHADIKPSNILITESGKPKLIDFGIMQFVGVQAGKSNAFINQYLCAMTVNYAAPEQLQGQEASIQSDVYALGGLLYFILSGKTPFEEIGGALAEKIKTISEDTIPPCSINHKVKFKSDLDWILQTALAKQPEQRYRSVGALTVEVNHYINDLPLSRQHSSLYKLTKSWQRHKVGYVLSVTLFICISLFATKTWYDNIHIQQSYQELSSSYLHQYTSLQEVNNKTDVIKLPSPDFVPIELYIKLTFQKFEQEKLQNESEADSRGTIRQLKKVLFEKGITDSKLLNLVEVRAICSFIQNNYYNNYSYNNYKNNNYKNNYFNNKAVQNCQNLIQRLLTQEALTPEEKIDILSVLANEINFIVSVKESKIILSQLDKILTINPISPLSQIKYNSYKAYYYTYIAPDPNIDSIYFIKLALSISKKNADITPAYLYLDTLNLANQSFKENFGFTMEYLNFIEQVKIHLSQINFPKNNAIASTLSFDIKRSELQQNINNYSPIKREELQSSPLRFRLLNVIYTYTIGQFGKASKNSEELSKLNDMSSFPSGTYDNFAMELNLKKGDIKESIDFIKNTLLPEYDGYDIDFKAHYLAKFCVPLSYHLTSEEVELYCKQPYFLIKGTAGESNFWTDYTLNQLVWWYGLNPLIEEDKKHIERLESVIADSMNYIKLHQLESLVFYFISRTDIKKTNYYLELLDKTIKDYAGDTYVIHIDRSKTFRAEVKLLEGHRNKAIKLLKEVANNVCKYQPKNYLRMHLNQVAGKAGITDTCSTTFL